MRAVHDIEVESFRRLRTQVDLRHLPPLSRAVIERVVHASGDVDFARNLILDEVALERGREALMLGAPIAVDARMVAAGITSRSTQCALDHADPDGVPTRTASGVRALLDGAGADAVWVIGCAPTALYALLESGIRPPLTIGLPVGWVDAAESKAALATSGLPAITNAGPKGGSAVAAAALNALLYT